MEGGGKVEFFVSKPPKSKSEQNSIFLNNLPFDCREEEILELVDVNLKEFIEEVRIIRGEEEKKNTFGYLDLNSQEGINLVLENLNNNRIIRGQKIIVNKVENEKVQKEKDNKVAFLKGLSFKSNEKDIQEFFGEDKI